MKEWPTYLDDPIVLDHIVQVCLYDGMHVMNRAENATRDRQQYLKRKKKEPR